MGQTDTKKDIATTKLNRPLARCSNIYYANSFNSSFQYFGSLTMASFLIASVVICWQP